MTSRLLDSRDIAELLHISRTYAYVLMQRGDIRTVRIGRTVRVRPSDLDRYVRDHSRLSRRTGRGPLFEHLKSKP